MTAPASCATCGAVLPEVPAPITDARRWAAAPWPVRHRRRAQLAGLVATMAEHGRGADRCNTYARPANAGRRPTR